MIVIKTIEHEKIEIHYIIFGLKKVYEQTYFNSFLSRKEVLFFHNIKIFFSQTRNNVSKMLESSKNNVRICFHVKTELLRSD